VYDETPLSIMFNAIERLIMKKFMIVMFVIATLFPASMFAQETSNENTKETGPNVSVEVVNDTNAVKNDSDEKIMEIYLGAFGANILLKDSQLSGQAYSIGLNEYFPVHKKIDILVNYEAVFTVIDGGNRSSLFNFGSGVRVNYPKYAKAQYFSNVFILFGFGLTIEIDEFFGSKEANLGANVDFQVGYPIGKFALTFDFKYITTGAQDVSMLGVMVNYSI
jgi:hypothetical protein